MDKSSNLKDTSTFSVMDHVDKYFEDDEDISLKARSNDLHFRRVTKSESLTDDFNKCMRYFYVFECMNSEGMENRQRLEQAIGILSLHNWDLVHAVEHYFHWNKLKQPIEQSTYLYNRE